MNMNFDYKSACFVSAVIYATEVGRKHPKLNHYNICELKLQHTLFTFTIFCIMKPNIIIIGVSFF